MLERDGEGDVPHAYRQLTAAYRRIGNDPAARLVQLAQQRRRGTLPWYGRLVSLLVIGSLACTLHHPAPLKADEAPRFNPVFYTLDLLPDGQPPVSARAVCCAASRTGALAAP